MSLTWIHGADHARCIPCDRDRDVEQLFTAQTSIGTPMRGTLCPTCGSVTVHGGEMQVEPDDVFVDHYLQSEAGIDTIVQNLYRVDRGPGTNFLDVGANYGFAVRYARDVLGWNALGIEPSYAGRRGARELGVEILDQYVTAETRLQRRFDVILASEVIEHVADPREFVVAMRAHLAPDGVLIMTTPAAEIVRPATESWAIQAVGPGGHLFLASAEALQSILSDAGFGSFAVERDGPTLYVAASVESGRSLTVASHGPSAQQVATFFASIEADPASPVTLRAAMSVRHYRTLVNMGHDAAADEAAMIDTVLSAHGINLADPAALSRRIAAGEPMPILVAPAAFACGMRRVVHRTEWAQAAAFFALAEASVADKRARFHTFDGDSRIIESAARQHRVLALLHTDPAAAASLWLHLVDSATAVEPAHWTVRLCVEASVLGHSSYVESMLDSLAHAIIELGADGRADSAIAGLDGAYLLSRAAVGRGDKWCATQWASVAEQMLDARRSILPAEWVDAAVDRFRGLRDEITPLQTEVIPSTVPMPGPEHEAMLWPEVSPAAEPGSISVIMALYRGERYVRDALDSIAAQSRLPGEVIVVDDGSPDNAASLLESVTLPFELRIIRQGNAGQSAARNTGIRAARGEFIAFLDQDDLWRPEHLEVLAETLEADPSLAWVFADFDLIDADGNTLIGSYLTETGVVLERRTAADTVRTDIMALPSASLMRRSALELVRGFDRRLSGYEDDELYLRLYRRGFAIAAQLRSRIRYRTHPANASSSVAFLRSRLVYLQLVAARFPATAHTPPIAEIAAPRLLQSTVSDYFTALTVGDDQLAREVAWAASQMLPLARDVTVKRRVGLALMMRPRTMRGTLSLLSRLPLGLRRRFLPPMIINAVGRVPSRRNRSSSWSIANDHRPRWIGLPRRSFANKTTEASPRTSR